MVFQMEYHYLKKVEEVKKGDGFLEIKCEDNMNVKLYFYKNNMFRLKMHVGDKEKDLLRNVLFNEDELEKQLDKKAKIKDNKKGINVKFGTLEVIITKEPWQLKVLNEKGEVVFEENVNDVRADNNFVIYPIGYSINKETKETIVRETIKLFPEEHIFGLGEKFMPLDKKGRKLESWSSDPICLNTTDISYKNIPFFLSTRGYGIFINSTNRIVYDFGSISSISYSFEIYDTTQLDYFFIYGPLFKEIIYKYTELTGKPEVPLKWSFGLWMSRCMYKSRKEVEEVVRKMKKYKIPFDVIHLDPLWLKGRKELNIDNFCEFEWDEEAFPNPKEFIDNLHKQGIKICLWENPHVHKKFNRYQEGLQKKFFPTRADGDFDKNYAPACVELTLPSRGIYSKLEDLTLVDFTNPEAVKWYQEMHLKLLKMGVDTFKPDYGEWSPIDAKYYNGMTGKEMHNLYPLLYQKTVYEVVKQHYGGRAVIWGRSAYAGIQKYPLQWSGDPQRTFEALAQVIRAGLSYGLSGGAFWSNDIGSFWGKPTPELYIRWAQFGLFCSHARCHGTTPREPWEFGPRALKIFKFYAKLRYRLLPYIYSYAYIASRTGLPIIRALVLEYQHDPNVYIQDLEYLFGRELLIAPIFSETNRRNIYLPEGKWINFWTKEEYKGPVNITYYAKLEELPIFIKSDSIIVYGKDREFIVNEPEKKLILDIYLDNKVEFSYQDDYEMINFSGYREKNKIFFSIPKALKKEYVLQFNKITNVKRVKINGSETRSYKVSKDKTILKLSTSDETTIEIHTSK
jgi:alpha-D-xyloside xylohydrolase